MSSETSRNDAARAQSYPPAHPPAQRPSQNGQVPETRNRG